ncbi:MAG: SAM-dependent methyltransferase [Bacteroidia bacterium]|nr:SAM-dependent methyltransferase [Bacteroidia bacterium]
MNFYTINYSRFNADLCKLEMKYLFNHINKEKYFFSDRSIKPSRSPFIKERLTVIFEGENLDSLVEQVVVNKFAADHFKVIYQQVEAGNEDYQERLRSGRELGTVILGKADVRNPRVTFGVTRVNGRWFFGTYEKNDYRWHQHDKKPHTYSSSINFRVARALVNIGVGPDTTQTLIDPCCGVGTVVIEALSMGVDAQGYEINIHIAHNAQQNLSYFGYPDVITEGDMHTIEEHFDVAIIDIPYGLYQPITPEEQLEIIKTARRISNRLILVSFENMDEMIREAGFELMEKAKVPKAQLVRWVNVCE